MQAYANIPVPKDTIFDEFERDWQKKERQQDGQNDGGTGDEGSVMYRFMRQVRSLLHN